MIRNSLFILALTSTVCTAQTIDNPTYQSARDQADADYHTARNACEKLNGNSQDICEKEAKVTRAEAELQAIRRQAAADSALQRAELELSEARYDLAKEKCDDLSGDAKDSCRSKASTLRAALIQANTANSQTAVLVNHGTSTPVGNAIAEARDTTVAAANRMGERTAEATADTRERAAELAGNAQQELSKLAQTAKEKTAGAVGSAQAVMSDTMITAQLKADMAADETVKALNVHVDTRDGVVMLSGFVSSNAQATRAVELAKKVDGVTDVRSAILVTK